jgi:hypothetical protein
MIGTIRRLAGAVAVVVALLGVSTTNMHAAQASTQSTAASQGTATPPLQFNAQFRNEHTSHCMDDSFASGLRSYTCDNALDYQVFTVTQSAGYWVIKNTHTGGCIDDSAGFGLRSHSCNGLDYQDWIPFFSSNGNGGVSLENANTGRCIDDSFASGLRSYTCDGGLDYQTFVNIL